MSISPPKRFFHPAGGLVLDQTLILADLHLEKGTRTALGARDGGLVPPYDTRETLRRVENVIQDVQPEQVIFLGDTFDDIAGWNRLNQEDRQTLEAIETRRKVIWVKGNHDPWPASCMPGCVEEEVQIRDHVLRHEASPNHKGPEIEVSGHFHPVAKVRVRGSIQRRPCFVEARHRLILPALGAYTGGLNVLDPAFAPLQLGAFYVHLLGRQKIYRFPVESLAT